MAHIVDRRAVLPLGSLAALVLATSQAAIAHGPQVTTAVAVVRTATAGPYRLTLSVGPLEPMYTVQEAKKRHPKGGEVMVSGTMTMGNPMPDHHLEVHVMRRSTGKIVTRARVVITIFNAKGTLIEHLPIAVMYGVREGVADTHFGNNVALGNGAYRVVVGVERATATFSIAIAGGMSM